ncbi:ABC transporter substrate-binding protein [Bacillus alveayuensis]|uniref:Iron complex transport system substrate-binding protein n=1 Tax=Aeribacillus alveayuensis TaxID=279215 RepID=A0ABT9VQ31_9BACI|nr:ABC transporter substrate-binding protein [Bacillus alveayuensis]MDQ0163102.1 iron complex transport system substrate-binding protein [Bacillus alveayuensis]
MKKFSVLLASFLLLIGVLVGCSGANTDESKEENTTQQSSAFPVTVKDALGNEITIEKEPERIVSLIPSNTEIAFELGLGDKMVGVSDFDNYPEEVNNIEKIGGQEFNVEKILSLNPDLVLAHQSGAHNAEEGLNQLRDAGVPVFVVKEAASFDQVYETIQTIGKITGTNNQASEIVQMMKTKVDEIEQKAAEIAEEEQMKVFMEVSGAPTLYTAGKGTFMDEMLTIINAKNIIEEEGWPQVTEEAVIKADPDVIITTYGYYVPDATEQILNRDGWDNVSAVQNKRVYDVNSDLVSRPGPRLIEGVEELAKAVYPEIFDQ